MLIHPGIVQVYEPGFVYVAFVIGVFSRATVGWRVSSSMRAPSAPSEIVRQRAR